MLHDSRENYNADHSYLSSRFFLWRFLHGLLVSSSQPAKVWKQRKPPKEKTFEKAAEMLLKRVHLCRDMKQLDRCDIECMELVRTNYKKVNEIRKQAVMLQIGNAICMKMQELNEDNPGEVFS